MHYLGSKARHAAEIIAITTANRRPYQVYVEPFVGGGNVINKVQQGGGRIANDKNSGMVALLDSLGNHGWVPPEKMTKSEWQKIMKLKMEKLDREGKALFAFAATGPTFGSMWCGQWAKDYEGMEGTRYRQARDAALKDAPGLTGIKFFSGSYDALEFPEGSLVYCDPPYVGTTDYSGSKVTIKVDEDPGTNMWKAYKFWRWADRMIDERGCTVFVSEYKGPSPGEVYGKVWTPELKAEHTAAQAAWRALDAQDKSIPGSAFEEARARITAAEEKAMEAGERMAARWNILWEKEVVSDFSASRGSQGDENAAKKETEKLFGRG